MGINRMIKLKKIYDDSIVPRYANKGDAGADLYAHHAMEILPGGWALVGTGVAIALPPSWVGLVHPRSGLAVKKGLTVLNAPGTVDSGYRGEIFVNLINHSPFSVQINKGDRIAQIVFQQFEQADFLVVDELDDSERGDAGHGSTGENDG